MGTIGIIGGGAAGVLTALRILSSDKNSKFKVIIFDKSKKKFGLGAAYGTTSPYHLLNVRAEAMSLFQETPEHFTAWLAEKGYGFTPKDFVPRQIYGKYIDDVFSNICNNNPSAIETIHDEVTSLKIEADKYVIQFGDTKSLPADYVVIATGNFPPHSFSFISPHLRAPNYFENPWTINWEVVSRTRSLVLIGSGLTAVDVGFHLIKSGYQGKIVSLSRHGLLPSVHTEEGGASQSTLPSIEGSLKQKIKILREWLSNSKEPWQHRFDLLRPVTQSLWQSFTLEEAKRFIRHLQPYWDIHRHRIDPHINHVLAEAAKVGHFSVIAAKIESIAHVDDSLKVSYRPRHSENIENIDAECVINCTGPSSPFLKSNSQLISQMMEDGLAVQDKLKIGIRTTKEGKVVSKNNNNIWAIGSLRRGELWETTALREIKDQALLIARQIVSLE